MLSAFLALLVYSRNVYLTVSSCSADLGNFLSAKLEWIVREARRRDEEVPRTVSCESRNGETFRFSLAKIFFFFLLLLLLLFFSSSSFHYEKSSMNKEYEDFSSCIRVGCMYIDGSIVNDNAKRKQIVGKLVSFIAFKLLRFDKDTSFTKEGRTTFMRLDNKKKKKKERIRCSFSLLRPSPSFFLFLLPVPVSHVFSFGMHAYDETH